jgi:hypothetical protein
MRHLRKSPGLIALLVYALLLNALAISATTAHALDGNSWCVSSATDRQASPQQQNAPQAAHDACMLACVATGHLAAGDIVGLAQPDLQKRAVEAPALVAVSATRIGFSWQARAPPLV